jgi:hypothetical protein
MMIVFKIYKWLNKWRFSFRTGEAARDLQLPDVWGA